MFIYMLKAHYSDVIRSAWLAFVRGIHWSSVDSPHKGPVTRKMFFLFDDVFVDHYNMITFNMMIWGTLLIMREHKSDFELTNDIAHSHGWAMGYILSVLREKICHLDSSVDIMSDNDTMSPGVGLTETPFDNFSIMNIWYYTKSYIRFIQSSYLTGATATLLWWYLSNMNMILNR